MSFFKEIGKGFKIGLSTLSAGASNYFSSQEANEQNYNLWKEQMAYNTPAMQMQRYKEAGLNPNLAYQMADNGNAGTPPQYIPQDMQGAGLEIFAKVVGGLEGLLGLEKKKAEIDTQKATIDNINADTKAKMNENSLFGLTAEMRQADLENKLQQNFNLMQQRYLNKAQYDNLIAENKNIIAQLQVIKKQAEKYGEDILLTRTQRSLLGDVDRWRKSGEQYGINFLEPIGKWIGTKVADSVYDAETNSNSFIGRMLTIIENLGRKSGNGGYRW